MGWVVYLLTVVAVLAMLALAYLVWVVRGTRAEVATAPRQEMVECHTGRHGPIPKTSAMEVSDLLPDRPVYLCPFCFEEAMQRAKHTPPREKQQT